MDIPKSSDKPWYKSYDPNVPQTIDLIKYNSISDLLEVSFKNYPSSPGFYNFGESLSFLQINELSHAYAGYLQSELGLEKGDRIAIIMPNILQYPVCLFGAWLAGLVVVNVPFVNSSKEMKEKLTETGVKCVQVLSTHAHILETALPGTQVQHVIVTDFGDLFDFPKNILFNFTLKYIKKAVPKWLIHDYIPFSKAVHPRNIKNFKKPSIQQNDLALLSYTAGRSTGNPKCVMLSHRNLIANSQQCFVWSYSFFRNKYHEPILTPLPFFVVATITCSCLSSFRIGMSNHLITNPFDTMSMIQEMKQIPSSAMIGIPTLFNKLLDNEKFKTLDFSSLKFVFCGGMNVSPQLDSKWKSVTNTSILQAYGLEEASPIVMINPLSKKRIYRFFRITCPFD